MRSLHETQGKEGTSFAARRGVVWSARVVWPAAVLVLFLCGPAAARERPDPWITAKTKAELLVAKDLPARGIHVDTVDGRVSLYGYVHTPAQQRRAAEMASRVEGVEEVENLLQVVPTADQPMVMRQDREIQRDVRKALTESPALRGEKVRVLSVENGVVRLGGEVSTILGHLAAIEDTLAVPGVRNVVSDIEERNFAYSIESWSLFETPDPSKSRSVAQRKMDRELRDVRITALVKTKLLADPRVPALDVHVDTSDHEVTLFGVVTSPEAMAAAEQDARTVSGVRRVDNRLRVIAAEESPRFRVSDDQLAEELVRCLREEGYDDVRVKVTQGSVVLSGRAGSSADELQAATLARTVNGVAAVEQSFHR